ncbi:MAG: hypothetical protein GY765_37875 [bacterium]|nr:hypothetical protein [bacterium]
MDIKKIFQNGMKEFKRKTSLFKEKKHYSQKEKIQAEQHTSLGKKAWETKVDIEGFGNSKELISKAQIQLDELDSQLKNLETEGLELEEKKKKTNESFDSQRKEMEDKKRTVDESLNREKNTLKEAENEISSADNRLKQIGREKEKLEKKTAEPETTEADKSEIKKNLDALMVEASGLEQQRAAASGKADTQAATIKPLQEESDTYQKQIDHLNERQRAGITELDESLSTVSKEVSTRKDEVTHLSGEQTENFKQLGDKLAAAGTSNESVAPEMEAVKSTQKEMEAIQVDIQALEHQGTSASRSALWKMVGLVAGGIAFIVLLIFLISLLFSSSDKKTDTTDNPFASEAGKVVPPGTTETPSQTTGLSKTTGETKTPGETKTTFSGAQKSVREAVEALQSTTGTIKEQSEKIQGHKIVVTDKNTFITALPVLDDWKREKVTYNKSGMGNISGSNIRTDYVGTGGQRIKLEITDTGTASSLLATYKMALAMKMTKENDNGYEKVTTYNGIPVIEKYRKKPPLAEFIFVYKDRYLVQVKCTDDNGLYLVKGFIKKLDLSKLQ